MALTISYKAPLYDTGIPSPDGSRRPFSAEPEEIAKDIRTFATIAEHDDHLAAMAFEDLLVVLRDNQLGELWRQEPLQPADPPKFLDLLSNPCFEAAVQLRHLTNGRCGLKQPEIAAL